MNVTLIMTFDQTAALAAWSARTADRATRIPLVGYSVAVRLYRIHVACARACRQMADRREINEMFAEMVDEEQGHW